MAPKQLLAKPSWDLVILKVKYRLKKALAARRPAGLRHANTYYGSRSEQTVYDFPHLLPIMHHLFVKNSGFDVHRTLGCGEINHLEALTV